MRRGSCASFLQKRTFRACAGFVCMHPEAHSLSAEVSHAPSCRACRMHKWPTCIDVARSVSHHRVSPDGQHVNAEGILDTSSICMKRCSRSVCNNVLYCVTGSESFRLGQWVCGTNSVRHTTHGTMDVCRPCKESIGTNHLRNCGLRSIMEYSQQQHTRRKEKDSKRKHGLH